MRVARCSFLGFLYFAADIELEKVAAVVKNNSSPSSLRSGDAVVGEAVEFCVSLQAADMATLAGMRDGVSVLRACRRRFVIFPSGEAGSVRCYDGNGRMFGRMVLSSGEGVAGLLLDFWCRIWMRKSFSQMRSSIKFSSLVGERLKWRLIFDEVFLARKTVFLLLLRCTCQRTSDGWFAVFVGISNRSKA